MVPRRAPGGPKSHIGELFRVSMGDFARNWVLWSSDGLAFCFLAHKLRESRDAAPVYGPPSWENKRKGPIRSNGRLACDELIYLSLL